ncbi:MAG: AraC family transcriptional regulator [Clostridiales bacterium]|jgi:AraC-like DNA-binding protein/mannose-6-phosphate isomerase-like protein (cupin superfamily)|nr:AraC family transcriptional regulator [Clostridiales bacterium]
MSFSLTDSAPSAAQDRLLSIRTYTAPDDPQIAVMHLRHGATNLHAHDCYEIVLVQEGSCLHETGGRTVLLMAGDLFIIRPGDMHRYISNHDIALFNCLFTLSALGEAGQELRRTAGGARLFASQSDYLDRVHLSLPGRMAMTRRLEGMMAVMKERAEGWQVQLRAELTLLAVQCARLFAELTQADGDKRLYLGYVSKALQYIDAHHADDLSISEIARQAGVSPDYFTRQFRQVTGITPIEYLCRYRLARAMALLRRGEAVQAAAGAAGFRSLSHFSREFKRHIGTTPSGYRKEHMLTHSLKLTH